MEAELFDGTILEFPDGTPDEVVRRVAKEQTALKRGAAAPVSAAVATPPPAAAAPERGWLDTAKDVAGYADDTGAVGFQGVRDGAAMVLGAPVDLLNFGLEEIFGAGSDKPVGGSENFKDAFDLPSRALASVVGGRPRVEPQDAFQRIVGRTGQEVGSAAVPLAGIFGKAAQVGREGLDQLGPLARYFVEPAVVAPSKTLAKETAMAVGAGQGAGIANEIAGNPQQGDNFWSDFLGSLAGAGITQAGMAAGGMVKNAFGALTGKPQVMDDIAGEEVVNRIINSSTDAGTQFEKTGRVDTRPIAEKMRVPAPVERAVPDYTANIGDRLQDPLIATMVQNQDMRSPGAANSRRAANDEAIAARMADVAPQGDPAQFRASLSADRDAQIAEVLDAENMARLLYGEAEQAAQPVIGDATARGSSMRSSLQDKYDKVREDVARLWEPINDAKTQVDITPLRDRFGQTDSALPMNDRERFRPSEADIPAALAPDDTDGAVPINEVTAIRGGLSDTLREQRGDGQRNAARVTQKYQSDLDAFLEQNMPPELRDQYAAARDARADQGNRFERGGDAITEVLRPREGGGYRLDDSAVAGKFAQPDNGRLKDFRALMKEAGDDPRAREALADEVLADVQKRGLAARPDELKKYLGQRQILLKEFPELGEKLTRLGAAADYKVGVEQASADTQKRLTTPGRSAQANYLQYGDEATVDAVRNLVSGPQPREAAKALLQAAGDTPEARVNARAALWEVVKTKKFAAPNSNGAERVDARKIKALFDDPKTAAVAEELWADNPEDLASIKELFGALAGAEGSIRTRAPNSSGTAQALSEKFDPAISGTSIAARVRSVQRGFMSPSIAVFDVAAVWLRRRSAQVQARAIDTLASAAFNNPGLAADLLERYNPADAAASRRYLTQKYGVRGTQVANLLDEMTEDDEVMEAVGAGPGPMELTVTPADRKGAASGR